jgi:signal transduction histidine kinase
MFGFAPQELLQQKSDTILQDRPAVGAEHEIYDRLQRTGYDVRPGIGIHKDGVKFPVDITTARLLEQHGSVMLVRDITERRRVEQLRENLTHMLVHDLRNPLFGISGNLHLVSALSRNLTAETQTALGTALDFAKDMGEMLHCLTDVTQLEAGKWALQPAVSDVNHLVEKALATLAALVSEKRHSVVWSRTPAPLRCDPELIGKVVLILLRNAVAATPSGGRIEIRVERLAKTLRVSVSDNGPGMPRECQTMIFEMFGQTPEGQEFKRHSPGPGLIFCRLAVEAHGGTIGVESPSTHLRADDTDQGSTFWFELPAECQ